MLLWCLRSNGSAQSLTLLPVSCAGRPDPSVERWCDPSGRSISLPAPCAQTALCSVGGQVKELPDMSWSCHEPGLKETLPVSLSNSVHTGGFTTSWDAPNGINGGFSC